jgi:hypothetical protein
MDTVSQPSQHTLDPLYWNKQYQSLLDEPDSHDKFLKLRALAADFSRAAEVYGKIIISERYLPVHEKTIPPALDLDGFAGGEKYIWRGILFKFAIDKQLEGTHLWMYGGSRPNDSRGSL